ncbi:MAG: SDR family NAD(P)-dependent oxidoreductase [Segniliparus sp.]|uniref:SDR family NAD(P)-dependent oxidoreductase n=1 Tax=Segniliparus sp. TaxID=2804064 RepID=UPI003F3917A1
MKVLVGKVATVSGAASGIGRGIAVELARHGARLSLTDINSAGLQETAELCRSVGAEAKCYQLDVRDRSAVIAHADEVVADFGGLNIAINNAGVAVPGLIEATSWQTMIAPSTSCSQACWTAPEPICRNCWSRAMATW